MPHKGHSFCPHGSNRSNHGQNPPPRTKNIQVLRSESEYIQDSVSCRRACLGHQPQSAREFPKWDSLKEVFCPQSPQIPRSNPMGKLKAEESLRMPSSPRNPKEGSQEDLFLPGLSLLEKVSWEKKPEVHLVVFFLMGLRRWRVFLLHLGKSVYPLHEIAFISFKGMDRSKCSHLCTYVLVFTHVMSCKGVCPVTTAIPFHPCGMVVKLHCSHCSTP